MSKTRTKQSIVIAGHKTSISLESEFWRAFRKIAAARGVTCSALAGQIEQVRPAARNLSSAIRVFVLENRQPEQEAA